MKQLLILRHAKSSWENDHLSDFQRPLNGRGRADAPRMGKLLAELDLRPELIISSSAKRARLTADAVAAASSYEGEIIYSRDLYMAMAEDYIEVLRELGGNHKLVMVVGHNPGVEELLEMLSDTWERMPTAALALIELPINDWHDLPAEAVGRLAGVWRPKELQ